MTQTNTDEQEYKVYYPVSERCGNDLWKTVNAILEDGLVPLSIADLMDKRIAQYENPELKNEIAGGYFRPWGWSGSLGTGDLFVYNPVTDKSKIVLFNGNVAQLLRELDPATFPVKNIRPEAMRFPMGTYEKLPGLELTRAEAKKLSEAYTAKDAKKSSIWLYLARGSQQRLDAYVDRIERESDFNRAWCKAIGITFDEVKMMSLHLRYPQPSSYNGAMPLANFFSLETIDGYMGHADSIASVSFLDCPTDDLVASYPTIDVEAETLKALEFESAREPEKPKALADERIVNDQKKRTVVSYVRNLLERVC